MGLMSKLHVSLANRFAAMTFICIAGVIGVICLSAPVARSADAKADAKEDAASIGEIGAQKLKGFTYFYGTARVTLLTFPFKLAAMLPELQKAMDAGHVRPTGPMVLIYHGEMEDPAAEYDVELGYPVADKTHAVAGFKVRELPEYQCLSVLYRGALGGIMSAYEKLIPYAEDNTVRTDETRVMFLLVESAGSPNNVLHVSVGVKP